VSVAQARWRSIYVVILRIVEGALALCLWVGRSASRSWDADRTD
jgi:hypothetical protein